MGNKVKLAFITHNTKRKAAFRKRKIGILKRLNEITTLCGIEACGILYDNNNPQPVVWPTDSGAKSVLSRFASLPESEQSNNKVNQEDFLWKRIEKDFEKLKKEREETRKNVMAIIINHYIYTKEFNGNSMSKNDLNDMSCFIDENLKEIYRKMEGMKIESQEHDGNEAGVMNETKKQ
ncbi:agamous-like MADS-box protein AGL80 [Trifolium pratense]|uniref:agamous-like MADS-box protein AGL80 n=1 Tax=Trifolium pratense TaxID=57577 RepID=UPI001E6934CA|nr:agamous-like MADS-box protein AGL80 [Trifolium pratense]